MYTNAVASVYGVFVCIYRIIGNSSPNINNGLLIGCVISYSVVFIKIVETPNDALCKVGVLPFVFLNE